MERVYVWKEDTGWRDYVGREWTEEYLICEVLSKGVVD